MNKTIYNGFYYYKDAKTPIQIENDGDTLSFSMYGIQFVGDEFSDFKTTDKLEGEILNYVELWYCRIPNLGITE